MTYSERSASSLPQQLRERFVSDLGCVLPALVKICESSLLIKTQHTGSAREMQMHQDILMLFRKHQSTWLDQTRQAFQRALLPSALDSNARDSEAIERFELIADGVIDNQILASRLTMRVLDSASPELNALRLRIQYLEGRHELPRGDILLPEVVSGILVDQWFSAQMDREGWLVVQDVLASALADNMLDAYKAGNAFLVANGVMKKIDLQSLVKRGSESRSSVPLASILNVHKGDSVSKNSGIKSADRTGGSAYDETQMLTSTSPLARARLRAQGVVGRLKHLLSDRAGGHFDVTQLEPTSSQLEQAIRSMLPINMSSVTASHGSNAAWADFVLTDEAGVERTAAILHQRTVDLKKAATSTIEKATIEVVALMFQSILAEERIPAAARVWFARLQIPVLRVALVDPDFFSNLEHPARRLIDRMGSCVMGFESAVDAGEVEVEIKRVVQVIEQYPETGRQGFQMLLDEFETFLSAHLSEQSATCHFVSIAQQFEQKETWLVQYTIEFRKLLDDIPVAYEIREFLFQIWTDVLAVASVKYGGTHEETLSLKKVASELLWAASAKPNRNDRARVIQQLPSLLRNLRRGMGLLGYLESVQDQHIKSVSDSLTEAFMDRTEVIPQERLDKLADALTQLEGYLPGEDAGDLDFDNESIEMITGVDASNIEIINGGGSSPTKAARMWATELQIGSWFELDHTAKFTSVQLAWCSDRGQLFLFVTSTGRCFLMQVMRVAAYLQAGLLVAIEDEALTVRATRDALSKLNAHPERLLS